MHSKQQRRDQPSQVDTLLKAVGQTQDDLLAWWRTRLGLRGLLLYVLATPLAFAAIISLAKGNLSTALASGIAFTLISLGAFLNRRGILEALVGQNRRFTHSWNLPYKYLGALSTASGTTLAAVAAVGQDVWVGFTFGLLALLGFHMAYRLPSPGLVFGDSFKVVADKKLHRAFAEAESRILAIEKAALRIGNRELEQRLQRIAGQGRAILEQIIARPEERYRARKFLNVYLEGAEGVASRYVRTHRLARGRELEQNFRNVLEEIEKVFGQQLIRLAEHDIFDLDVQIEVLRQQLKREGIV